jgi:hypothetical protein
VVIVDNGSTDRSRDYLENVFKGVQRHDREPFEASPAPVFANLQQTHKEIIERPGDISAAALTVIAVQENQGFAAGCNIGLKALMACKDFDQYLLLNPDALLTKGSLAAFARRLADPETGLCGASVLRYEAPHEAQAFAGAAMHRWTLLGDNIGAGKMLHEAPRQQAVEAMLSYPLGAAMACRSDYIDYAGLLDERYFLYYEEADWAQAGSKKYHTVWAPGAVVYHRHGAAAGSRQKNGGRSPLADYHMARSRMLFAAKWRPELLPVLVLSGAVQAARRLLRGHGRQARSVFLGSVPGAIRNIVLDH